MKIRKIDFANDGHLFLWLEGENPLGLEKGESLAEFVSRDPKFPRCVLPAGRTQVIDIRKEPVLHTRYLFKLAET